MRLNPHYPAHYVFALGQAYMLMQRTDEAIVAINETLARAPDFSPAHRWLAIIHSELGRDEEARAEMKEILRLSPNASLSVWRERWPAKHRRDLDRYIDGLRKGGMPD